MGRPKMEPSTTLAPTPDRLPLATPLRRWWGSARGTNDPKHGQRTKNQTFPVTIRSRDDFVAQLSSEKAPRRVVDRNARAGSRACFGDRVAPKAHPATSRDAKESSDVPAHPLPTMTSFCFSLRGDEENARRELLDAQSVDADLMRRAGANGGIFMIWGMCKRKSRVVPQKMGESARALGPTCPDRPRESRCRDARTRVTDLPQHPEFMTRPYTSLRRCTCPVGSPRPLLHLLLASKSLPTSADPR